MPFISSVIRPALPMNCAFAFSRSAGVAAWANAWRALSTMESRSFCISEIKTGLAPQALALSLLVAPDTARAVPTVNSSSQLGLDLLHDTGKSGLVVHGDVRQDLAVDLDAGLADAVGELAVGQAQFTGGRVDTGDPELAEHALL